MTCRKARSASAESMFGTTTCIDLRKQFGIVLQDPYLFTGTICGQHPARHERY